MNEIENLIDRVVNSARNYGYCSLIALAGVPGTGKSYVAEQVALRLSAHSLFVKAVQFHPGFTYDDFIEGFRPVPGGFALRDGLLLQVNEQAHRDPDNTYVLLIEELTRANISAVLGELLTYIEYRGRRFTIPSGREVRLAPNLVFLTTYNPMDRSALELDDALIRRLRVISIPPSAEALSILLPATTPAEIAFKNSLVSHYARLCSNYSPDSVTPLPFGHAVFRNLKTIVELRSLWDEQLKFLLRRPSLPPHPLADEIEELINQVGVDMEIYKKSSEGIATVVPEESNITPSAL
jgi:5-methylcytosine-specific restriction protein B